MDFSSPKYSRRTYGGAGLLQQLIDSGNSVSGGRMADAQQAGYLNYRALPGIEEFRYTTGDPMNTYTRGVFGGDAMSGSIDPEALAAYLDSRGLKIGEATAPNETWRWVEDANGGYALDPVNSYTDDKTAAILGMLALGGVAGNAIAGGVGMSASGAAAPTIGSVGAPTLGGALPEFGAGLADLGIADITGSTALTGGAAGAGQAGLGTLGAGAAGSAAGGGMFDALKTIGSSLGWQDLAKLGLAAYGASQAKDDSTTQSRDPWKPAQPFLLNQLATGAQLQEALQKEPFNPIQKQAMERQLGLLNGLNSQALPGLLSGLDRASVGYQRRGGPAARAPAFNFGGSLDALQQAAPIDWAAMNPFRRG